MKNPRKTLADKLHSFKRALYVPIAAAGLYLSSSSSPLYAQEATRTTETEEFNSEATISKSNIRYPDDYLAEDRLKHWNVNNGQLVINDYNENSGWLRYHWNNSTFNFAAKNGCIITTFNKNEWGAGDFYGLVFAGDPIGNNYYEFVIRASPNETGPGQFSINQINPNTNVTFINAQDESIVKGGTNKLEVRYNSGSDYIDNQNRSITEGWNFFINNKKVAALGPQQPQQLEPLDGYVGIEGWDSTRGNDTYPIQSNVYFERFIEEFDTPNTGGGGNAKRIRKDLLGRGAGLENKLIPDSPKVFKRGDSNMDQTVNISDAVYTLNSIFREGQPLQCLDSADANDDGAVDISDAVKTLLHLFAGQGLPYPNRGVAFGGIDLTYDQLQDCQGYPYEWPNATGR